MPPIVKNYLRAAPYVGTGGIVDPKRYAELKKLGIKTIINLNTDEEGAATEGKAIAAAGIDYVSIPVSTLAPDANEVKAFSTYVNDPKYYPILVHCESSNRVGAMWALYRAENGVPAEIAVQEGRTVGLKPSRGRISLGPVAGEAWRIGCMGHTARRRNVTLLLAALRELLAG